MSSRPGLVKFFFGGGGSSSASSGGPDLADAEHQESIIQSARASVLAELHEAKDLDLESRRRVFKALLLKYHPDKNPGNEAVSSITFQFVMKQKEWFSVAA